MHRKQGDRPLEAVCSLSPSAPWAVAGSASFSLLCPLGFEDQICLHIRQIHSQKSCFLKIKG